MSYCVLAADPPWPYADKLPGNGRGAAKHYSTLSVTDIARFPLPTMARNSLLFLWRVTPMAEEALFVMRAWGFKYYGELVWEKTTKSGEIAFGMGRIFRQAHETCLVCVRGRPVLTSRSERSIFRAQVGEHSQKPEEFYRIVERLSAGPYVELFARKERPGWSSYGDALGRPHP